MNFTAICTALIEKKESFYVLLKFAGHLIGDIPKELGELKMGKTYRITIEEEEGK